MTRILLHHFQWGASGQRMGNVRVPYPVGTGGTQALGAARISCIQLGRAGLEEALDLPVQRRGCQRRLRAGLVGLGPRRPFRLVGGMA